MKNSGFSGMTKKIPPAPGGFNGSDGRLFTPPRGWRKSREANVLYRPFYIYGFKKSSLEALIGKKTKLSFERHTGTRGDSYFEEDLQGGS